MEDTPRVQYFALIRDGGTAEDATGLVRRIHTSPRPTDEAIHNDLQWHPTEYLVRYYVLGSMDREHVEIDKATADRLLTRWRENRQAHKGSRRSRPDHGDQ